MQWQEQRKELILSLDNTTEMIKLEDLIPWYIIIYTDVAWLFWLWWLDSVYNGKD